MRRKPPNLLGPLEREARPAPGLPPEVIDRMLRERLPHAGLFWNRDSRRWQVWDCRSGWRFVCDAELLTPRLVSEAAWVYRFNAIRAMGLWQYMMSRRNAMIAARERRAEHQIQDLVRGFLRHRRHPHTLIVPGLKGKR